MTPSSLPSGLACGETLPTAAGRSSRLLQPEMVSSSCRVEEAGAAAAAGTKELTLGPVEGVVAAGGGGELGPGSVEAVATATAGAGERSVEGGAAAEEEELDSGMLGSAPAEGVCTRSQGTRVQADPRGGQEQLEAGEAGS